MIVEIINVGTELLLGEIVNTNATMIQKMCKELGFDVFYQSVVGDNENRFLNVLDTAFKRGANCIITTGGLGPTDDDVTKELSAKYLQLEIELNEIEAKKVFDKCAFVMQSNNVPKNNIKQAYFPRNAFIIENDVGTANGCIMSNGNQMIINLPGPPKELAYCLEKSVLPYLKQYQQAILYTQDIVTLGIGESSMALKLKDIIDHQDDVSIALYASETNVRVRLATKAISQSEANFKMKNIYDIIVSRIGDFIVEDLSPLDQLKKIMPKYHIEYLSDFKLPNDNFIECHVPLNQAQMIILINTSKHQYGEIIEVTISKDNIKKEYRVPLLKAAKYSLPKLQAKLVAIISQFLESV